MPMFITSEPPRAARSGASSELLDMIGDEPTARATLAAKFWTTRLVMLWQSGFFAASALVNSGTFATMSFLDSGCGVVDACVANGGGVATRWTRSEAAFFGSAAAMIADTIAMPSRLLDGVADW